MRFFFHILLLIFPAVAFASGVEGYPMVKNFEVFDYMGGSKIYSVITNNKGIIYAGDKTGILEFDGEKWNKIECGFLVSSMASDTNDVIYVAGNRGIGLLEVDSSNTASFHSLNHLLSQETIRNLTSSKVYELRDNIVFVLDNKIVLNTPEKIRIIEAPIDFNYSQKIDDTLYLYSKSHGIYKFTDSKLQHLSNNAFILDKEISGFYMADNHLFIICNKSGIFELANEKVATISNKLSEYVAQNTIRGVEQLDDSTYALITQFDGLGIFNSEQHITNFFRFNSGLPNNTVLCVCKDRWKNLWMGTSSGISSIRLGFPFSRIDKRTGIGTAYGAESYFNDMYFASSRGLYKCREDYFGSLELIELFEGRILGIKKIDNYLYFGHASGIYAWDTHTVRKITDVPSSCQIKKIPHKEDLYLASTPRGLLLLQKSNNGILQAKDIISGMDFYAGNFEFDSLNTLWTEIPNGIAKFNLSESCRSAENMLTYNRIESGNKLRKVRKLGGELLYIADSAIYTYNIENNEFREWESQYNEFDQKIVPSNVIIDQYDRIWAFEKGALNCYIVSDKHLDKASIDNFGSYSNTFPPNFENVYCLDSDRAYIGTEQGFLAYKKSAKSPGVYSATIIRKIQITSRSGDTHTIWGNENFLEKNQNIDIPAKISYKNNSVKFYFSAGCSNYGNVKYQTYLNGYDSHWNEWSNESIREYTNLPPGEYIFIIRSINNSNEFGYIARCKFIVARPWHTSLVAKFVYFGLLILCLWLIDRLSKIRAKSIQEKNRKNEEEKSFRTQQKKIQEELKQQKEIIKLRNEKLRIDNLHKSKELANSTMGIIKKNQSLMDIKKDLISIKELSEQSKILTDDLKKLIRKVNREIDDEENWKVFEDYFDRVHEKFLNRIKAKYPQLTSNDLRLCAYIKMNLSTKEIAPLMNITVRGVEIGRYRLRKKLEIQRNKNLNDFLLKF